MAAALSKSQTIRCKSVQQRSTGSNVPADIGEKIKKLPDFSKIQDVKKKKRAFFDFIYPIIERENTHILQTRLALKKLATQPADTLTEEQRDWLQEVARYYKVEAPISASNFYPKMLTKVDFIPPSLALTQAAIESGWGSSRFARKANNLFGQWCFSKGCGLVPKSREADKSHEVAKFSSVNQSVRAYLHNLNTNTAYQSLRARRAELRKNNQDVTGTALAKTLLRYSEEGELYVKKVTQFIQQNKLFDYKQQGASQ